MKKSLLLFALIMMSNAFSQTNYYVSTQGSDSNTGTAPTPQGAWRTIQRAANTNGAPPGSIVNIAAGMYEELVEIKRSGTLNNPIIFKNNPNEIVVISKPGTNGVGASLVTIRNKSYIEINGLYLQDLVAFGANGVYVESSGNTTMSSIVLKNLNISNIKFSNQTTIPSDPINHNANGISVKGINSTQAAALTNVMIDNCDVHDNVNGRSENITINGNVDGFSITNNRVYNNTNIGIDVAGNYPNLSPVASLNHSRNGTISGNQVYNNNTPAGIEDNAGIYCDGCWYTTIEKNATYSNKIGIAVNCEVATGETKNVIVRENIVYNNKIDAIEIGATTQNLSGLVSDSSVYNNTCLFNNADVTQPIFRGEMKISKVQNCQIFQNIMYCSNNTNTLFYVENNVTPQTYSANYNCYYSPNNNQNQAMVNYHWDTTLTYNNYKINQNQDANSIFSNPQLTNTNLNFPDFHLLSNSPCINAGNPIFVPSNGETDYYGNPRINMTYIDIGADEYQAPLFINQNIKSTFKMIPNPSNNNLIITFGNQTDSEGIIKIHDFMGKQVFEKNITNQMQIDISNYQSGVYIVSFESKNTIDIQKLIIKH